MPHDKYPVLQSQEFSERFCLHPGLYPGILRGLLPLASVVGNPAAVLDHCLVTAAGKSKIDRHAGIVITLRIRIPAQAKPDTQGRRNPVADIHRLDVLKKRELICF